MACSKPAVSSMWHSSRIFHLRPAGVVRAGNIGETRQQRFRVQQTIAPTYRDNQMKVGGKIYGFPDDGDVFIMYYRRDLFEDPAVQKAFKDKTGKDLAVPKTWADFDVVGAGL